MVAGQLETKEFETIIIIYPRQIKAKTTSVTIIVPILPPLGEATTEKRKISPEGQGHMSQQAIY